MNPLFTLPELLVILVAAMETYDDVVQFALVSQFLFIHSQDGIQAHSKLRTSFWRLLPNVLFPTWDWKMRFAPLDIEISTFVWNIFRVRATNLQHLKVNLPDVRQSRYLDLPGYPKFEWHLRKLTATVDFHDPEILAGFLPFTLRALELTSVGSWLLPSEYRRMETAMSNLHQLTEVSIRFRNDPNFPGDRLGYWGHDIVALLPQPDILTHLTLTKFVLTETLRAAIERFSGLKCLSLTPERESLERLNADQLLDTTLRSVTSPSITKITLCIDNIPLDCTSISHLTSLRVLKIEMAHLNPANLEALAYLVSLRKIRIKTDTIHHALGRSAFLLLTQSWPAIHQVFFEARLPDRFESEVRLADLAMVAAGCPLLRKLEMRIRTSEATPLLPPIIPFHPEMWLHVKMSRLQEEDVHRILPFIKALNPYKASISSTYCFLSCDRLDSVVPWRVMYGGVRWEGPEPSKWAEMNPSDSEFDE